MITIAIELNHVIRNINKQILKYYQRDFKPELDLDEVDEKDDVFKTVNFDSKRDRNEFIYIDYPYEIFACAKPMDKDLPRDINKWMEELTNIEDENYRVIYYSLDEEALTIQSSFFFLSKIGTRVREIIFPQSIYELIGNTDVVITSNNEVVEKLNNVVKVLINRPCNEELKEKADFNYNSLSDILKDESFLNKIKEKINNKDE